MRHASRQDREKIDRALDQAGVAAEARLTREVRRNRRRGTLERRGRWERVRPPGFTIEEMAAASRAAAAQIEGLPAPKG